jgi:hypothetical protein
VREADQVWAMAHRHLAPFGHLQRIENRIDAGTPDVSYCLRRVEGMIENKIFEREGSAPRSLTLDQVTWIERRIAAGGRVFVLGRCGPVWLLYAGSAIRSLYNGEAPAPLVRIAGKFPLRQMLDHLAPIDGRMK